MIEATIINYLNFRALLAFSPISALAEIPEDFPEMPFCIVEKTGGGRKQTISTSTIAIQCYADTRANAAALCEQIVEWMEEIVSLDEVTRCELNSSYNYPDTTRKHQRYQAVFDVVHY